MDQFRGILLAIAVLLTGATCTMAGCVLPTLSFGATPEVIVRPCCAVHHGQAGQTSQPDGPKKKDCPLCHNSILVVKATDQSGPGFHGLAPGPLLVAQFDLPMAHQPLELAVGFAGHPELILRPPPTLLALHCALLN